MSVARLLAAIALSSVLASAAELSGSWSASSSGRILAGTWTAAPHQQTGGVTGAWTLRDPGGKILMSGSWSASKSPQTWNGAWRAMVAGGGEYSGTWTAESPLAPEAPLAELFASAVRAVVAGTWKAGPYSGSWSIRASP
jgi:hypothetical protein